MRQIMYDRTICTGDESEIDDSLESFPSGHSTAAFAGFVFLSIYLNAKLKVWSNYQYVFSLFPIIAHLFPWMIMLTFVSSPSPAMWKLIATYAPILGATLIAGALTIDEFHNWYDCLAGAIIGTIMAFSSYRMVYASIWDWRTNHIPLNRATAFPGTGVGGEVDLEHAVFTRKVGWGGQGVGMGEGHVGGHHGNGVGHHSNGVGNGSSYTSRKPVAANGHHHGSETMV